MAVSEKRLYQRYFVILHQGDRGYGIPGGKEPTGYAKIEVKSNNGRMTALFQNLKQIDNNKGFYKVYLVSKSNGNVTPVKVGPVEVDQWGKGSVEWEFNPADVGGSGLDIEKFNIVTLAYIPEPLDKDIGICFPMVGHMKKDINVQWKEEVIKQLMAIAGIMPNILKQKPEQDAADKYAIEQEATEQEATEQEAVEQDAAEEDEIKQGATEQDTTEEEAIEQASTAQGQSEVPCDKIEDEPVEQAEGQDGKKPQVKENTLSSDEVEVNVDADSQNQGSPPDEINARAEAEQSKEQETVEKGWYNDTQDTGYKKTDENRYASWYAADKAHGGYQPYGGYCFWDRMEWYYKRLFSSYMTVQPFDKEMKGVEWIRVDIQKSYNYVYAQNYFMNQFYGFMANPYDHYIVGLQKEDGKPKYIIYGMPGRYIREEQPFGGQTGYVYWQPAKGQKPYPGAFGYWLAYIDVISGTIAFPKKPIYL